MDMMPYVQYLNKISWQQSSGAKASKTSLQIGRE